MKKILGIAILVFLLLSSSVKAQEARFIPIESDSLKAEKSKTIDKLNGDKAIVKQKNDTVRGPSRYGWNLDTRSGVRTLTETGKTYFDFHQTSLVDGQGITIGYLANLGSPSQSKLFFERGETGLYPFLNPFENYYKKPEELVFLNTKMPYTNLYYQDGGGRLNGEQRLKVDMSLNSGKKFNIGLNFDYVYSRGAYMNLSNKQFTYDINASYISDRYQMHAYIANNYYNNSENGGIIDDRYITDPTGIDGKTKNFESNDIPSRIEKMWNKLNGKQLFLSNKYDLGYEKGNNDSTEFIPVASLILTTKYADQRRRIASKDNSSLPHMGGMSRTDSIYFTLEEYLDTKKGYMKNNVPMEDHIAYWSLKNTFAVTLNEGFKDWVKFGLTAFIEQDFRKYTLPGRMPLVGSVKSQNSTVIGGILSKQQGKYLRYNLKADLGVIGYNIGEFRAEGDISTHIRFAGQEATLRGKAYIKNLKPSFYENNFNTKYISWENDFGDIRRVFVGGEIVIPQTNTRISGGVENLDNYIYYGEDRLIAQTSKNIQVISLRLDQKLKAGIFHWDNQIAYQMSSEKEILPLPTLSAYTNIYITAKIAKVLSIQLGVDAHFHTKYYAPTYEPVTLQFNNQREVKVGGFPIATGYMNLNLKNTRFFLMMYNIAESMGNSEYFSLPHYPVNPMGFKMGISWDFNN